MFISTSTSVYSDLGSVTNPLFTSIYPWLILVSGIALAFYFGGKLVDLVYFKDKTSKTSPYLSQEEINQKFPLQKD